MLRAASPLGGRASSGLVGAPAAPDADGAAALGVPGRAAAVWACAGVGCWEGGALDAGGVALRWPRLERSGLSCGFRGVSECVAWQSVQLRRAE